MFWRRGRDAPDDGPSTASGAGLHGHNEPPESEQQEAVVKEETRLLASGNEKSAAQASTTWPPGRSPDSSKPPSLRHDREGRQLALKPWLPEVMLLVAAGALLAAVFAVLCSQNGRLQRDWRLPITLNSLANLLSTLFRAAVVAVAAGMICQAKWTWFWSDRRSARRMADLQHFDSGSRGLLGSLQLARTVALRSPSTLVAVFVIVSSFAVGPFVQQAIKTREGTVEVDKGAVISTAQPVNVSYWFFQAATTSNGSKVLGRFLDGAFNETCEWRNQLGESLRCRESFCLSEFWAQGRAEARSISDRMSWTADALTNQLRRGLGRTQGSDLNVKGRALEYATFFVIDAEWLLFPALLLLLEAALLGPMIGRAELAVPRGGGRVEEQRVAAAILPGPEMEKDAENVSMRFSRWREGDSSDGTRLRHIVRIGPTLLVSVRRASAHVSRYQAPWFNDSGTKIAISSNKMPPSIVNGSSALPKVLCLHGGGTSARIFGIQLARLTRELSAHFEFVYLDAPIKTGPGPGVLPFFEGCDPFFRWVSDDPATPAAEFQAQKERTMALLKDFVRENGPFVGLVGFSQGARAAASLLLEDQREPFFGGKVFGLFICGTFPPFVPCEDVVIAAPTVHVIGLEDPWEPDSEELLGLCDKEGPRRVVRFPEGHHLPTSKETIAQISRLVLGIYRENVASAEGA
ncbi:oxidoreductase [Colletotrichum sojae]|uniref:Oxidoreductase n=1 Tax=Colletotrichum sojae TaxID=2175907 RepID=A0A8H6JDD9_9PEZI|nr:oxidoreductase [Colletotrichum sojae]